MPKLLLYFLSPILILQGYLVKKKALRLPEPDGERSGLCGAGEEFSFLILGDSAAAGVGVKYQKDALLGQLTAQFSTEFCVRYRLIAKIGETTSSIALQLKNLEIDHYEIVIVNLGVNDVTRIVSDKKFTANLQNIISHLEKNVKPKTIILCGLPPVHRFPLLPQPLRYVFGQIAFKLDESMRSLAANSGKNVVYFKQDHVGELSMMAEDGFHPGKPVYARWAVQMHNFIRHIDKI